MERADKKVDELKGQLSDRDSELAAAQRKLVAARDSATAADVNATHLASQASLGVPGTPRGIAHALSRGAGSFNEHLQGAAATAAAAAATSMMADMQREIEGLKETLAARTAELDAEREVVLKLRREAAGGLGGALSQAPDDAAVRESAASRAQAAEVARLSELAAAREAEVARLRQSAAALEAQAQHAAVLDMATRRQQQQLEEYGARIVDLEARLRDADALRDRLQRQVRDLHPRSLCSYLLKASGLSHIRCGSRSVVATITAWCDSVSAGRTMALQHGSPAVEVTSGARLTRSAPCICSFPLDAEICHRRTRTQRRAAIRARLRSFWRSWRR